MQSEPSGPPVLHDEAVARHWKGSVFTRCLLEPTVFLDAVAKALASKTVQQKKGRRAGSIVLVLTEKEMLRKFIRPDGTTPLSFVKVIIWFNQPASDGKMEVVSIRADYDGLPTHTDSGPQKRKGYSRTGQASFALH